MNIKKTYAEVDTGLKAVGLAQVRVEVQDQILRVLDLDTDFFYDIEDAEDGLGFTVTSTLDLADVCVTHVEPDTMVLTLAIVTLIARDRLDLHRDLGSRNLTPFTPTVKVLS
jgi:hypothetical protein